MKKRILKLTLVIGQILTIRFAEEIFAEICKLTKEKIEEARQEKRILAFRNNLDNNLEQLLFKADAEKNGFGRTYRYIQGLKEANKT